MTAIQKLILSLASNNENISLERDGFTFRKMRVRKLVFKPDVSLSSTTMLALRLGRSSLNQVCVATESKYVFFALPIVPGMVASYSITTNDMWDYQDADEHPQSIDKLEIELLDETFSPFAVDPLHPLLVELEFSM